MFDTKACLCTIAMKKRKGKGEIWYCCGSLAFLPRSSWDVQHGLSLLGATPQAMPLLPLELNSLDL